MYRIHIYNSIYFAEIFKELKQSNLLLRIMIIICYQMRFCSNLAITIYTKTITK